MTGRGAVRRLWVPACFCLLAVIVFATQFAGTGFGIKGQHYAWVSSHNLAIFSRATPENGFVGHTRSLLDADGTPDYLYFDRYPPFFSALLAALIHLTEDLATKVWIARQLMLVIYVLTMLFSWLLLRRLGMDRRLALAAVSLAFSGHLLLYHRELIHFDQPALMGMMLLFYAIARAKLEGRERWRGLSLATLVAVGFGSNLLALAVLGLWAVMEAVGLLWRRELPPGQRLRAILRHDATRMLLLGTVWSAFFMGYNMAQEMSRRDVPPEQTGIVLSLQSRLPGGEPIGGWQPDHDAFAFLLEERLLRWYLPLDADSDSFLHRHVSLPLLLLVVYLHLRRQSGARRMLLLLTAFTGLITLFAMINLSWFHNFTTNYALGFALIFWMALLGQVRQESLGNFLLLVATALFLFSALNVEARYRAWHEAAAVYTDDYNRILQEIGYSGSVVFSDPALQDRAINIPKYLLSFYLGDNYLATRLDDADYMVADRAWLALPGAGGRDDLRLLYTVTPENQVGFLFDLRSGERHAPGDVAPRFNFGNALTLGHWELLDGVEARPCQGIRVESWWQAQVPLSAGYRLQLSLVGEDGGILASADSAPVGGDTQDWHPGRWYPDGRTLRVPCEAAGAWSLILSVYDPETDALNDKLPLVNADGSAGHTWLYLTTVSVN